MEIIVDVNRNLKDSGCFLTSGSIIIIGSKVVKFTQTEEQKHKQCELDIKDIEIIKSKEATYEIEFINKYDKYCSQNNAKIQIKNGSTFYTNLSLIERAKLKWMLKKYRFQNPENQWKLITFIIGTAISIIVLIYTMTKKQ